MLLCAITDGTRSPQLLDLAAAWAAAGIDFIQLREKDLAPAQLVSLATSLLEKIDRSKSRLLVNVSAAEAALPVLAAGVDGVHLAGKPTPGAAATVRREYPDAMISVPCHNLDQVEAARKEQVDLILFSPIFEKLASPGQGLAALAQACAAAKGIPVLALGGVTAVNADSCVTAGAAGVAGIRLFAGPAWPPLCVPKARYIVE